ncbi:MAG: PAS domain S-box protein [Methanomicrobiaceae archaeon]|nr:PAS domain S-box protein [Methanomicrobiaceae archaeon]
MLDDNPEHASILNLLKDNPRGMSLKQITDAMGMNRITVARYLDILKTSGRVDMEPCGQAKVYYLADRTPISAMLDFTSSHILIINSRKKIISANLLFLNLFGLKEEEILGQNIDEIIQNEDLSTRLLTKISEALSGVSISEEINVKKDGRQICFRMKMIPTVFYSGQPGVAILLEDITAEKKMEEVMILQKDLCWKLSSAGSFEEALPHAVRTAIYILEMDAGGIYLVNDNTGDLELFFSEGLGKDFLTNYTTIKKDSALYNIILEKESIFMNEKDFHTLPRDQRDDLKKEGIISVAVIPIKYRGKILASFHMGSKKMSEFIPRTLRETESLASLSANVITRLKALDELKNSENHYRMLFKDATDMIFLVRFDDIEKNGSIIEVNDMACKRLGYDNEEFQVLTIYDLDTNLSKKEVTAQKDILQKGGRISAIRSLLCKNGDEIPVELISHLIILDGSKTVFSLVKILNKADNESENP